MKSVSKLVVGLACAVGIHLTLAPAVAVEPDTTGPVMLSAIVSEVGQTNQIVITFDERLLNTTVNLNGGTQGHFSLRVSGSDTPVAINNVFYGGGSAVSPESYAVLLAGGPNWDSGSSARDGTIGYYLCVNNVRDANNNAIAPNSCIGVQFPVPGGLTPPGAVPTNGVAARLDFERVGNSSVRFSWPTNIYGYTLESTTNVTVVGSDTVFGPWYQVQTNLANGMVVNFPTDGPSRFFRLHKVP